MLSRQEETPDGHKNYLIFFFFKIVRLLKTSKVLICCYSLMPQEIRKDYIFHPRISARVS
jgi:hypothetical protein